MPDVPARIHVLPEVLTNQIAAGEVVERPASVLKELIENSLDANAKCIQVDVEEGGVRLIRVTDDGSGIRRDDLKLAMRRHATSKIFSFADLQRVVSLGFRGEALPSIGSVSKLILTSRTPGCEVGWSVWMEGQARISEPEPAPHPVGTTVEVRSLFFNVPARRKFLLSERTEYLQILEVVKRMALSFHGVGFRLTHNARRVLNLKPVSGEKGHQSRIRELCGADFALYAIKLDSSVEHLRVSGWVGRPGSDRFPADIQYVFLNGRAIRDKTVVHALRRASEGLLPDDRPPAYIIYLEIDPGLVDVNVHPSKSEVRFRDNRLIHDFIYSVVRRALMEPELVPETITPPFPAFHHRDPQPQRVPGVREPWGIYVSAPRAVVPFTLEPPHLPPASVPRSGRRALGLFYAKYLLVEEDQDLVIVDIEKALEWVFVERLKTGREGDAVCSRPLLIPETVALSSDGVARVIGLSQSSLRLGLHVEAAGSGTVVVRQVPVLLQGCDLANLIREIAGVSGEALNTQSDWSLVTLLARYGTEALLKSRTLDEWEGLLGQLEQVADLDHLKKSGAWRKLKAEDFASLLTHDV